MKLVEGNIHSILLNSILKNLVLEDQFFQLGKGYQSREFFSEFLELQFENAKDIYFYLENFEGEGINPDIISPESLFFTLQILSFFEESPKISKMYEKLKSLIYSICTSFTDFSFLDYLITTTGDISKFPLLTYITYLGGVEGFKIIEGVVYPINENSISHIRKAYFKNLLTGIFESSFKISPFMGSKIENFLIFKPEKNPIVGVKLSEKTPEYVVLLEDLLNKNSFLPYKAEYFLMCYYKEIKKSPEEIRGIFKTSAAVKKYNALMNKETHPLSDKRFKQEGIRVLGLSLSN